MSGFFLATFAAFFAASSSVITGKTVRDQKGGAGYFTFYFFISFLAAFLTNYFFFPKVTFNLPLSLIGCVAGVLLMTSMAIVGKGVQKGPSGLTFAFLNSGAIAPPLILALIFSDAFGFTINFKNMIGMSLVVTGLFWGSRGTKTSKGNRIWFLYAIGAFLVQGLILTIYQWHALLLQEGVPDHKFLPFHLNPQEDFCFAPAMFLLAFFIQSSVFWVTEKRTPSKGEAVGGICGGIMNGVATFFLILATNNASEFEKPMLFPFFAALVILMCNLMERIFHQEKINWFALSLLAAGIGVGLFS